MENSCESAMRYLIFVLMRYLIFTVAVSIISFLGCCGSLLENKCMLYTYATSVIINVIAGKFVYISTKYWIYQRMKFLMDIYGKPDCEIETKDWDNFQQNYTCCGIYSYTDWGSNLPSSCCDPNLPSCDLNLLFGIVNKLIEEMKKAIFGPEQTRKGKKWTRNFLKKNNIKWTKKRGGKLNGNGCRKFLKKVDVLEAELRKQSDSVLVRGLPFVQALRDFNEVVKSCFGKRLRKGYASKIEKFRKSHRSLGISVTPKVHIVETHLVEFFNLKQDGKGLGYYSEQAFEAVHADVKKSWNKVKVSSENPNFGKKPFDCVTAYNARHL